MFKLIVSIILIYLYSSTFICNNNNNNNYIKIKNNKIDLLVNKILSNEILSNQEKNRLYNFIDYKLSKNYNETQKWLYIKDKLLDIK